MTRWLDRLLARLGPGGRKPDADVSKGPAEHRPGLAETTQRPEGRGPGGESRQYGREPARVSSRPLAADDVTAVIARQHEHVKALLEAVRQQAGNRRAGAFHVLRLTLALHETAEEQAIHPQALHQLGAHDRAASDRIAEEQTAGQTIHSLELVDVDSDQFNSTFGHLAVSVTDHAAAEETDEWPALRQITDPPVIKVMMDHMQAVTRLVQDPSAPGIQATFSEMQEWAKAHLPDPPGLSH
jgi:hemerythrin superfamily protein